VARHHVEDVGHEGQVTLAEGAQRFNMIDQVPERGIGMIVQAASGV
jgi:hypothetical protein